MKLRVRLAQSSNFLHAGERNARVKMRKIMGRNERKVEKRDSTERQKHSANGKDRGGKRDKVATGEVIGRGAERRDKKIYRNTGG